ncbi:phage holin family protein [Saccharomonospora amisosensis]|uniref:phage holin family protein n=1 Tax=Saccharomonospora amisosensis TaxID=1128677 RepID=UPI00142218D5|nr:phage holin family protein [Saccharomonospora amisosensis]
MRRVSSPKHHVNDSDRATGVPYIPLSADDGEGADAQSIGALVMDATQHMSTLVRAEVELIKAETAAEAKKALKGSIFFVVAGVVGLYSSFFFFFFLGELLTEWLPRWAAFLIVFGLMLVTTALFGLLGYRKVKRIRAPQRSIDSLRETAATLRVRKPSEQGGNGATAVPGLDPSARR